MIRVPWHNYLLLRTLPNARDTIRMETYIHTVQYMLCKRIEDLGQTSELVLLYTTHWNIQAPWEPRPVMAIIPNAACCYHSRKYHQGDFESRGYTLMPWMTHRKGFLTTAHVRHSIMTISLERATDVNVSRCWNEEDRFITLQLSYRRLNIYRIGIVM
jgi:hypothetical protein